MKAYILLILGILFIIAGIFLKKNKNHQQFSIISGTLLVIINILLLICDIKLSWFLIFTLCLYLLPFIGICIYKRLRGIMLISFIIVMCFPVGFIAFMLKMPEVNLNEQSIFVNGKFGADIKLMDIATVDTVSVYPKLTVKRGGGALLNIIYGNYDMENEGRGKLYIYNKPPYVRIRLKDNTLLFINFKEKDKTVEFYNKLINKLQF